MIWKAAHNREKELQRPKPRYWYTAYQRPAAHKPPGKKHCGHSKPTSHAISTQPPRRTPSSTHNSPLPASKTSLRVHIPAKPNTLAALTISSQSRASSSAPSRNLIPSSSLSVSTKWQSSRPDQIDKLMKGSVHSDASAACWWKASQATFSADALSMLVMLNVGTSGEPLSAEERCLSA
jgi:hypothetical protein